MLQESHLYQEIHQQPDALAALLSQERDHVREVVNHIRSQPITHAVIAARGTSDNAARYAQYLFGANNRLPVALATPSLFTIYKQPPLFRDALVLGISQSGASPDIVSVLAEARRQGAITVAITNTPGSDLAHAAAYTINLHAGREQAVAATKTYTTSLAAIALLSASAAGDQEMLAALDSVPRAARQTLEQSKSIGRTAERYRYMRVCVVIGRGYNYATAFELALKIKELNYIMADPYSSADFMHGPVAVVDQDFPTLVVAPSGAMLPEMKRIIHRLQELGAEVLTISDDKETLALARTPLPLPVTLPETLSPLVSVIPGQLFAMHLAHTRGYPIDQPRGLHKVTETR